MSDIVLTVFNVMLSIRVIFQHIASKGFKYIDYICRWWMGGGVVIILGDLEEGQS